MALEFLDLDFNSPTDTQIPLSFSSVDFREPEKRKGTWSKTITMPSTKNNDIFFGWAFEIDTESNFDPAQKTAVRIDDIGLEGTLQLVSIATKNLKPVSYDVKIFSDLSDWAGLMGSKSINTLEYLDTHTFDQPTIAGSFNNTPDDSNFIYPIINYGDFMTKDFIGIINLTQFRPAIWALPMIREIYQEEGYSFIDTGFRNSKFFRAINPFTKDDILASLPDADVEVTNSLNQELGGVGEVIKQIEFDTIVEDELETFNLSQNAFYPSVTGTYNLIFEATTTYITTGFGVNRGEIELLVENGTETATHTIDTFVVPFVNTPTPNPTNTTIQLDLIPGDKVTIQHTSTFMDTALMQFINFKVDPVSLTITSGFEVSLKKTADDIKRIDYLKYFISAGNFYVDTDNESKTVEWIQRDNFLGVDVEDWTDKIDRNKIEEIVNKVPVRKLVWRYNNDTSDTFLESARRKNPKGNGNLEYLTDNEFGVGERLMADSVFSSTAMKPTIIGTFPVMSKESRVSGTVTIPGGGVFEEGFEPRVLICPPPITRNMQILDGELSLESLTLYTEIPYCYFFDSEGKDNQFSLHFDNVYNADQDQEVFTLPNVSRPGLVKTNYRTTVDTIENSKLKKVWLQLDDLDISDLDFKRPKQLDGNQFYLSKIKDYMVGTNRSTPVELISR